LFAECAECAVPGIDVQLIGIDQGAVNVEDESEHGELRALILAGIYFDLSLQPRLPLRVCFRTRKQARTDANVFSALSGEIALFALELVVFEGEESELRSLFIAISRPFEDNHVLGINPGRRPHDPFHLRLGHPGRDLIVVSNR
jgi:hypothetical protein